MAFDVKNDPFWTCDEHHMIDGKWQYRQWSTLSARCAETGCPQHGTEFLKVHRPEPKPQRRQTVSA